MIPNKYIGDKSSGLPPMQNFSLPYNLNNVRCSKKVQLELENFMVCWLVGCLVTARRSKAKEG